MTDTLTQAIYHLGTLLNILVAGLGIYVGFILKGISRTKAALLIVSSNIAMLIANIGNLAADPIQKLFNISFEQMLWVWIASSLLYRISFALLIFGLLLLAKEFQAFIKDKRFREQIQQDLESR